MTQAYVSMLEVGKRRVSPRLARKLTRVYRLPPTALPVSEAPKEAKPDSFAAELAALEYPGFAHLRGAMRKVNPALFLLTALAQNNLESRVAEGLPWLVLRYPDMDFSWLVPQARMRNLQNRLGFVVTLARLVSRNDSLGEPEQELTESKLVREDSFCRELNDVERRWLREHSSEEARQWNLLSDLRPGVLPYAA